MTGESIAHIWHSEGISPHAYIFEGVELGENVTVFPGAVLGRMPLSSGAAKSSAGAHDLPPLIIGDNCIIGSNAVLYAGSIIGSRTMICDTACLRERNTIGENCIIAMGVTINYGTIIGDNTRIMDNTHITGNAVIGDDVFIGMLVTMANDNSMGAAVKATDEFKGPRIRNGARIGQGACLFPSIEIGEYAVVGANSVVTRDVPAHATVMGSPARRRD
jgi:acetyltransferase-like isoleucine patch superfamily enzyme